MFDNPAQPSDEQTHPPGPEALWNESWYFDFAAVDGSVGGYVRIGLYPGLGATWYWACLVGEDRPLVTVIDHDLALPSGSLELRGDGVWADHNCEAPLERWSLGLEAFAVSLDDPADTYGDMRGDKVPFGFDLEWETQGEVFRYPPGVDRYEVPCRVHGGVQVGSESVEIDGVGQRDHSWGVRDWWEQGWCWTAFQSADGHAWHGVLPAQSPFSIGYRQAPGAEPEAVYEVTVEPVLGAEGIPDGAALTIGPDAFRVAPVAWAPVLLTAPDGRTSRFPRALARFEPSDPVEPGVDSVALTTESTPGSRLGRSGVGWIEFNQPDG